MTADTSAAAPRQRMRVENDDPEKALRLNPLKVVIGLLGMVVIVWALANLFLAFGYYPQWFGNKFIIGILAIVGGVGGAAALFFFLNMFVEGLPRRLSEGLIPYAFLVPGLALVGLMLIYPTFQTINYSFANSDSSAYVGLQNYRTIFSDNEFWQSILNNVLWLLIVPAITVAFGIIVAVLADKLSALGEKIAKSLIFLPMAISFVGASAIWGLVYAYNNAGQAQTGLLNAIWVGLGGQPQTWLAIDAAKLNSILLMVILIWLQVGFSMVLLSSAIKGVPEDTIEAGRIDGASELQIFGRIIVPQVWPTLIVVFITVLIGTMKTADIVYVMTNGNFSTNIIGAAFFVEMFKNMDNGRASAIVVMLMIAIIPVMIYQVKQFRAQEANR